MAPRALGTSKSRLLYLSNTSAPGAAEQGEEGGTVVENGNVRGAEKEREIKLKVDVRRDECR